MDGEKEENVECATHDDTGKAERAQSGINLVSWDDDNDPTNPQNWPSRRKWTITVILSWFSMLPPLSSTIISPAQFAIGRDLGVSNSVILQICLSVFNLGIAFGPLVMSPLSETYGRYPILIAGNVLFLAWNTGCGFVQNESSFIVCRFFTGFGSTASLSIMAATMGDMWPPEKRATAIGVTTLTALLGPAFGPIVGGYVTQYTTWRWILWATSIANASMFVFGIVFFRETYAPRILRQKAERLRKATGNESLRSAYDHEYASLLIRLRQSFYRPLHILGTQMVVQIMCVILFALYGTMFLNMYYFPVLWTTIYHQNSGQTGLNYISTGVGFILGSQGLSRLNDAIYRILKEKNQNLGKPEFLASGLVILGWTGQFQSHWILPNIGNAIFLAGSIGVAQIVTVFTVDAYSISAASALSSENFVRSIASFGFPLFAPPMFETLDWGPSSTILGVGTAAISTGTAGFLWVYGPKLRAKQDGK